MPEYPRPEKPDEALVARITQLIRALQVSEIVEPWTWKREVALRFNALPIYSDMGGAILLRANGEVLGIGWDDATPAGPADRRWTLIGLVVGVETFPELRTLLPIRPATATDCPQCKGTGGERWHMDGIKSKTCCGLCAGLGWIS